MIPVQGPLMFAVSYRAVTMMGAVSGARLDK
jgi:hypothetical protein